MEQTAERLDRRSRALVPLLGGIFVLLLLLVVALGAGGVLALHSYREARALAAPNGSLQALGADVVHRQGALAEQLTSEATLAEHKVASYQRRLSALSPLSRGAFGKLDQTIHLMQLMCDQMILLNHQLAQLEAVTAEAVGPLNGERKLTAGVGGSGSSGESAPQKKPSAH